MRDQTRECLARLNERERDESTGRHADKYTATGSYGDGSSDWDSDESTVGGKSMNRNGDEFTSGYVVIGVT